MKIDWKKIAPYLVALVVFVGFAVAYCSPMLDGKVLVQGDVNNWRGAAQEAREYYQQTGEVTWWTNSMFGGMPTYQITGSMPSGELTNHTLRSILHLGLPETMGIIFAYFFGFFLMLICFGVNPWLSIVGGLALGLSSYFFIIIPAGHVTKAVAIGFLAAVIGGVYAIFRKKYWLGIPLVSIYGICSIALHPQMTYYVFMLIGVMLITEIITHCVKHQWKDMSIALAVIVVCLGLIFGTRLSWLDMNQSYLKQTMRGGHSELTKQAQDKPAEGLDIKYATDWSYGVGETMTLLIPNWEGGASGYNVGTDSDLYKALRKNGADKKWAKQFCQSAPTYRGDKMFTSGAVYVGAIICFLFLLGLLIVPGPYKWALLFATLMSIFLAWGRNMMWLTEFFFNYFPMYNKFRAVESILVVAEIAMPLLGFLGLQQIIEGKVQWNKLRICLFVAGGVTAGICLFAALFAGTFDMTSSYDTWKDQMPQWLYDAILDQRTAMLRADAWRSLLFVLLGFGLTFWYAWQRNKSGFQKKHMAIFIAGLAAIILLDMVPVDKRFFNNDNFKKAKDSEAYFKIQPWEEEILQDKTLDYRVLNLTTSTFNDARTSYRLKSIGGYSAVKLRRYQDLIDAHISQEINAFYQTVFRTNGFYEPDPKNGAEFPVLNMLNMRYAIIGLRDGSSAPIPNPYALGNAWFVNEVQFVPTPDDESAALNTIDLHKTAVADEKFRDVLTCTGAPSATDEIVLTQYKPNTLTYVSSTTADRVAVFSEIYYPEGWHIYVDGEEKEIGRVNYALRAAVIPAGQHTIKMEFVPKALKLDIWSMMFVILCILLSVAGISWPIWGKWIKHEK